MATPALSAVRTPWLASLEPATALSEVLFGLIMTLTFTLGAGLIIEDQGREGARELLIAVIGCNIAWGIIDAALYLAGEFFDRSRLRKLEYAIRASADKSAAVSLVADELDPLLGKVLQSSDTRTIYERIVENVQQGKDRQRDAWITREQWRGSVSSFWLVVLSSVPAALPFLLMDTMWLALRVSNAVLLALLFFTGYWWARYTLGKPWIVGSAFLVIGLVLVLAAIALGG